MMRIITGITLEDFLAVIDEKSTLLIYDESARICKGCRIVYNTIYPHHVEKNIRRKLVKSIEVGQTVDFMIIIE